MIEIFVEGQKITSFYADADCVQKLGILRAMHSEPIQPERLCHLTDFSEGTFRI